MRESKVKVKMKIQTSRWITPGMIALAVGLTLPIAFGQTALTTAQIAKRVSPTVVVIQGKTDSGEIQGSGFIISKDGKIATNLHVIRDMKTASVQLANGEVFDSVSVLAIDERRDLAVVRIDLPPLPKGYSFVDGFPVLNLGNSDTLAAGESVVVVGSPIGLAGTVTAGIISSVRDTGEDFKVLQTDAAVNPGNSGGPLVNNKGQAIGVVSFKMRFAEGLNFAIPINYVRELLNNLHAPTTLDQMQRSLSTEPGGPYQDSNSASLKETLGWLREKIPLGIVQFSGILNGEKDVFSTHQNVGSLDSCTATIGWELTSAFTPRLDDPHITRVNYTLPLGIVNGGSVEVTDNAKGEGKFVSGDRWTYVVHITTSSKEVLSQTSHKGPFTQGSWDSLSSTIQSFELSFADESIARRVLAALLHAAGLCRKAEPL